MLLIAISHGNLSDPYTCSVSASHEEVNHNDPEAVLAYICEHQDPAHPEQIDEILVTDVVEGCVDILHTYRIGEHYLIDEKSDIPGMEDMPVLESDEQMRVQHAHNVLTGEGEGIGIDCRALAEEFGFSNPEDVLVLYARNSAPELAIFRAFLAKREASKKSWSYRHLAWRYCGRLRHGR